MANKSDDLPMLLTRDDLAKHLRVSERQLDSLRQRGELPEPIKVGSLPRWSRKTIEAWIEAQHGDKNTTPADEGGCCNKCSGQYCKVAGGD